jgi:glutathione S-transferase
MAPPEALALYQFVSCSFCARVRSAAEALGIELELRDIHAEAERGAELIAATGRASVPVLQITRADGEVRWLGESAKIIEYLEERAG